MKTPASLVLCAALSAALLSACEPRSGSAPTAAQPAPAASGDHPSEPAPARTADTATPPAGPGAGEGASAATDPGQKK